MRTVDIGSKYYAETGVQVLMPRMKRYVNGSSGAEARQPTPVDTFLASIGAFLRPPNDA